MKCWTEAPYKNYNYALVLMITQELNTFNVFIKQTTDVCVTTFSSHIVLFWQNSWIKM
jgi:hypothetical protein